MANMIVADDAVFADAGLEKLAILYVQTLGFEDSDMPRPSPSHLTAT